MAALSDDDWEDASEEKWDDAVFQGDDYIETTKVAEKKEILIEYILKCENRECGHTYYNTFICPKCNTINDVKFNKIKDNATYTNGLDLFGILKGEVKEDEAFDIIYEKEINLYMKPKPCDSSAKECKSCFMPFDNDETKQTIGICHNSFCETCLKSWIDSKAASRDIKPYIKCPEYKCNNPLPKHILTTFMDDKYKADFLKVFAFKSLAKYDFFRACPTYDCMNGLLFNFIAIQDRNEHKTPFDCECCKTKSVINYVNNLVNEDKEILEMIKAGKIKKCPTCRLLTTKNMRSCNVIQCIKCDMFWNWASFVSGPTYESVIDGKNHWSDTSTAPKIETELYFE